MCVRSRAKQINSLSDTERIHQHKETLRNEQTFKYRQNNNKKRTFINISNEHQHCELDEPVVNVYVS